MYTCRTFGRKYHTNMAGRFVQYSSSPSCQPLSAPEHERYLSELLKERQKMSPFMDALPNCSSLLNQEIVRVIALVGNSTSADQDIADHGVMSIPANGGKFGMMQGASVTWRGVPGAAAVGCPMAKKAQRIEVPVHKHPNFNFVGRILGPRGNSLKRVEATTGCRVLIRGRGSIKDSAKEDKMRDKPGFEHLNEPLHVLVEAELPASIIDSQIAHAREIIEELLKPVDETLDPVKKAQLRELAILNGTLREDSLSHSSASSRFNNPAMKRAKTQH